MKAILDVTRARDWLPRLLGAGAIAAAIALVSCQPGDPDEGSSMEVGSDRSEASAPMPEPGSMPVSFRPEDLAWASPEVCVECHAEEVELWRGSHHDVANRLPDIELDRAAFSTGSVTDETGSRYRPEIDPIDDSLTVVAVAEEDYPEDAQEAEVASVIGVEPLIQYLIAFRGGRYQTHALSWDPEAGEWFNVFGDEDRQPHEWGHWTQQGMNWNSNCAWCHMTEFEKNYDVERGTYTSEWLAHGVSCVQCHSGMKEHVAEARAGTYVRRENPLTLVQHMDTCATCHARREELTANDFRPGENFHDHYRLTLPDQPGAYFADGQNLDENYVYASFHLSRMGHKGLTCMDCHEPHSHQLKLPVTNNALCMSCHSNGLKEATIIDPLTHSNHAAGSAGNTCIECHMPLRTYMQRDPRRDHAFTSPDPQLTIDFGVPNTCNQCHTDQTAEWARDWVNEWYGDSERRQRVRDRAETHTLAHNGPPSEETLQRLIARYEAEENAYWRTTWLRLLTPYAQTPEVASVAARALQAENPLERDAAIGLYSMRPDGLPALQAGLRDDSRVVRIRSADTLQQGMFNPGELAFREWVAYAEMNADRPGGALRRATLALQQGDVALGKSLTERAVSFDSNNPGLLYDAAILMDRAGDVRRGLDFLRRARAAAPDDPQLAFAEGLLRSERGDKFGAIESLREAVELAPEAARWWYNLAIAYLEVEQPENAAEAIDRALALEPNNPEFLQLRGMVNP